MKNFFRLTPKVNLKKKTLSIIGAASIFVCLLSGIFYWFQYMPMQIRRNCVEQAKADALKSDKNSSDNSLVDKYYPQATLSPDEILSQNKVKINNNYRECLVTNGLKAESLFVNLAD